MGRLLRLPLAEVPVGGQRRGARAAADTNSSRESPARPGGFGGRSLYVFNVWGAR